MKGNITIQFDGIGPKMDLSLGYIEDFLLEINTEVDESFLDLISDKDNQEEMFMSFDILYDVAPERKDEINAIKKYVKDNIIDSKVFLDCENVTISGTPEEVATYIKRNPILLTKTITYGELLELDMETFIELKKHFKDIPNIDLHVNGNMAPITIDEYEKTVNAIHEIVDKVKRYNYSPFEALMYAYDLIRDRFYVKEDEEEEYYVSRDLSSSLLGDKIVCLGFANIFNTVCNLLGINSIVFCLKRDERNGHARNLVYLVDEKYDIDGLYFFDPTFDCKSDDKNNFLLSYRFFAKTYREMNDLCGYVYEDDTYKYFSSSRILDLYDQFDFECAMPYEFSAFCAKTKINTMLRLLNKPTLGENERGFKYSSSELIEQVESVRDMADEFITADKFIQALYIVRKNQYYENPEKYLFDLNALVCILYNSKVCSIDSPEEKLLAVLGVQPVISVSKAVQKVQKYVDENNLESDIERVKVTRVLKSVLEKKQSEEQVSKTLKKI